MNGVVIQNERLAYKMKGHSNFLPCFGVIKDVLELIERGQNAVTIQVVDPAMIPAHLSSLETDKLLFF